MSCADQTIDMLQLNQADRHTYNNIQFITLSILSITLCDDICTGFPFPRWIDRKQFKALQLFVTVCERAFPSLSFFIFSTYLHFVILFFVVAIWCDKRHSAMSLTSLLTLNVSFSELYFFLLSPSLLCRQRFVLFFSFCSFH